MHLKTKRFIPEEINQLEPEEKSSLVDKFYNSKEKETRNPYEFLSETEDGLTFDQCSYNSQN